MCLSSRQASSPLSISGLRPNGSSGLRDLGRANRKTVSGLVDTSPARLAKEIGFREPPER